MAAVDNRPIEESMPSFQCGQPSDEQYVASTTTGASLEVSISQSPESTRILEVVACLLHQSIAQVDQKMLECCAAVDARNVKTFLNQAVSHKLLIATKPETEAKEDNVLRRDTIYYQFPSQDVQEHTYTSIQNPADLHVAIGRKLLHNNGQEGVSFGEALVAHQFLMGESYLLKDQGTARRTVEEEEFLAGVASLCLSVGRQAIRASSDFETATTYFNFGIRILKSMTHYWKNEYDLCLHLHCACAEANYSTSNFEYAQTIIDELISNARSFEDTWGIHATQIYVLGAQAKRQESIALALHVCQQLDEPISPNPKRRDILWGFVKTRRSLRNKTTERILRLPVMSNTEKLKAMQVMNLILCHAVSVRPALVPMLVFRLVKLTLAHGLSVMSSVAFAHYAMMLGKFGQEDDAIKYAQLALLLYEKYPVPEWLPRVYLGVYAGVYSCIKNIECSVEPLKYASRVGLATGDNEVGFIDAHVSVLNQFTIGEDLDVIENDVRMYLKETTKKKLVFLSRRFMVMGQFFHNLRHESSDPTSMVGSIMNQTTYEDVRESDLMFGLITRFCRSILCYLFGNLETAGRDCSELCSELQQSTPSQHGSFTYLFLIDGLIAMARFREESQKGGKSICNQQKKRLVVHRVRRRIRYMKRKSLDNPSLCSGKLYLLQAELAWLLGKFERANFKYASAAHVSSGANLKFDLAVTHECLGRYKLFNRIDGEQDQDAAYHFQQAGTIYRKWGAQAKAVHLEKETARLLDGKK